MPKKNHFQFNDLRALHQFLWCADKVAFQHDGRQRISFSLILEILTYTAGRPGGVVNSQCSQGTMNVIRYKVPPTIVCAHITSSILMALDTQDITLKLVRTPESSLADVVVGIRIRHMKGKHRVQRHVEEMQLHSCRLEFGYGLDPVVKLLALAFADNAFVNDLTIDDLCELRKFTKGNRILPWKESLQDTPVFRLSDDKSRGIGYSTLRTTFANLWDRAGFLNPAQLYDLRRGSANKLYNSGKLTGDQLRQMLGHVKACTFARHYLSQTPFVDAQSIVSDQPERRDLSGSFNHVGGQRASEIPRELSPAQIEAIRENPELQALGVKISQKKMEIMGQYTKMKDCPPSSIWRQEYDDLILEEFSLRKNLATEAQQTARAEWIAAIEATPEGPSWETVEDRDEDFEDYIEGIPISAFTEERKRIARAMFGSQKDPDWKQLISDLVTTIEGDKEQRYGGVGDEGIRGNPAPFGKRKLGMIPGNPTDPSPKRTRYVGNPQNFYLGEDPIDGRCRFCTNEIDSMIPSLQVKHAHTCAIQHVQSLLIRQHNQMYDGFRCKWSNCTKSPHMIGTELSFNAGEHLAAHLSSQFICRWMDCKMYLKDTDDLRRHMEREHGFTARATPFKGKFCKPCRIWFVSPYVWADHNADSHTS